jgi:threonine dehydrogenase-like Zn-dependent dehydrogenase
VLGGIGSVPLYAVMFAMALGAERVDYVDRDAARCEVAARYGARAMTGVDPSARYDIAVDGTRFDPGSPHCLSGSQTGWHRRRRHHVP